MSKKIKIAILGVGNCCSALFQGLNYYKRLDYPLIGKYHPSDIEVVAAFDIDKRKVGYRLSEAIFKKPNCARIFQSHFYDDGPFVNMGHVLDGVSEHMIHYSDDEKFIISDEESCDIVEVLRDSKADILINYLPVGSQKATEFYIDCAIKAGVNVLNCIPVFIASDEYWDNRFKDADLCIMGDDIRSQFGASKLSQILQETLLDSGLSVDFHQQINIGGNTDFLNMTNHYRLESKKKSKENVINSQSEIRNVEVKKDSVFAGPSTYIPYLKDNKVAYLNLRVKGFADSEITIDVKLSVQDSENSAGVVVDAIRYLKIASDIGIVGALKGASAMTQKSPPLQLTFNDALYECQQLSEYKLTDITIKQVK